MCSVAPFLKGEERNGVVDVGDTSISAALQGNHRLSGYVLRRQVKYPIDIISQSRVPNSRFSKRRDDWFPSKMIELQCSQSSHSASKRMPNKLNPIPRILLLQGLQMRQNKRPCILPTRPKPRMNRAIQTLDLLTLLLLNSPMPKPSRSRHPIQKPPPPSPLLPRTLWRSGIRVARVIRPIRIRHVFLGHGTKIHDRVRNTIRPSERDDNPTLPKTSSAVVESDVAAAIAHQGPGVEGVD